MIKIGNLVLSISVYTCQPKTKDELKDIIEDRINSEGTECDLNDIDVSLINDMWGLFYGSEFNGDISNWDVSNVEDMSNMFFGAKFNGDISNWNVSRVYDISYMFCMSKFNQDISNWKLDKDCSTWNMFHDCPIKEEFKPKSPKQK